MGDHVHTDVLIELGIATKKLKKDKYWRNISKEQPGLAGQLQAHCCDTRLEQKKKKTQYWIQLSELNYFSQQGFPEN